MATKVNRSRKPRGKVHPVRASQINGWYWAALAGLALLLFYPPYLRGLFFPVEQFWTLMLAGIVWCLVWGWKMTQRDPSFVTRPWDYLALALVVVYVLTVWGAASQHLAMVEVGKVLLYFLVFWMVAQLARVDKSLPWLLLVLYASAVGVALAGFLTAVGVVEIRDGFVGGRIFSTLQYPNALASYLVAVSFIGYYLWARTAGLPVRLALAGGNYLLFLIFLGTGSRGGYLVYPVTLLLFLIGLPAGWRGRVLAHLVIVTAGALVANSSLIPSILADNLTGAWGWLLAGLAIVAAGHLVWEAGGRLLSRRQAVWIGSAAAIVVGVGLLAWGIAGNVTESGFPARLLPEQMLARVQDISLETRGSAERLFWTREALALGAQHPILGQGGGAWEATYRGFQSYPYSSTQVHNHYAQLWTEIGAVGLAIWAGLWLIFLWTAWQNYRRSAGPERVRQWAVGVAGISLGLHAFIDFDLSLGAISLVLWSLWGITRGRAAARLEEGVSLSPKEFARLNPRCWWLAAGGAAVVILLATTLLLGNYYAQQAVAAAGRGDAASATVAFRRATTFNPWNGSYLIDLAAIVQQDDPQEALRLVRAAAARERSNAAVLTRAAEITWNQGEWATAVDLMRQAQAADRWSATGWENLARMNALAGINYLARQDVTTARVYLEEAAGLPEQMAQQQATISDEARSLWETSGRPFLEVTAVLQLSSGMASYLLGDFDRAEIRLQQAAGDDATRAEALLWLAVLQHHQGKEAAAADLREQVAALDPGQAQNFDFLAGLPVIGPAGSR